MIAVDTNVVLRRLLDDDPTQFATGAPAVQEPAVVFEDRNAVWSAVNEFADARPVVTAAGVRVLDFADALVVYKAIATAHANGWPYEGTYTFDKAAQALAGARAL